MKNIEILIDKIFNMYMNNINNTLPPVNNWGLSSQIYKNNPEIILYYLPGTCFVSYSITATGLKKIDKDLYDLLSSKCGVYFLIKGSVLQYVGKSDSSDGVYGRVLNHYGYKDFDYVVITISEHPHWYSSPIIGCVEDFFIENYNPVLNKVKGTPGSINSNDILSAHILCSQLGTWLTTNHIYPNPKTVVSIPGIMDKMINSKFAPREKKTTRGLISDMGLEPGQEIVFVPDKSCHAFVVNNGNIRIYSSSGNYTDKYTLTSFATTWNLETGVKKEGDCNTMAGPKYWETLDGINLSKL